MIIYLHGLNSTGQSAKGQFIKQAFSDTTQVYTPTYDHDPDRAIEYLHHYVADCLHHLAAEETRMLVGSSLGGFYAQYLSRQFEGFKLVLINPALGPVEILRQHLGVNENFYTGERYILEEHHLQALLKYEISTPCQNPLPTLLLLDNGDEVIDYHFAAEEYAPCANVVIYEGGDHQFQHLPESLPLIRQFYFGAQLKRD